MMCVTYGKIYVHICVYMKVVKDYRTIEEHYEMRWWPTMELLSPCCVTVVTLLPCYLL